MPLDERQRRIGRNEAIFREVNERLERLSETVGAPEDTISFLCECGDEGCVERIELTREEYERLRSDPQLFAVVSVHEVADVEAVVEQREGYDVIRKRPGEAAELATELDPRA